MIKKIKMARKKDLRKKGELGELLKWALWIIFFLILLFGLGYLVKKIGII